MSVDLVNYCVNDLVQPNSRWTFILESPHTSELKFGYPAAGDTGIIMSKALFQKKEPLGRLITAGDTNDIVISLMNASCIPLQQICYSTTKIPADLQKIIESREASGQIPELKRQVKNSLESVIGERITTHFRKRLSRHISGNAASKYVVCGIVAQCIFEVATGGKGWFHESRAVLFEGIIIPVFYENHPSAKSGNSGSKWEVSGNLKEMLHFLALTEVQKGQELTIDNS